MTYEASVERDGRFWLIHVPAVDRHTQARSLREAEAMARDLVAVMTDRDPDDIDVVLKIAVPDSVSERLARVEVLRSEAASANAKAASESRLAARALVEDYHLSVADAGEVLGVSRQRVSQLVSS